jgi:hypothetical protein
MKVQVGGRRFVKYAMGKFSSERLCEGVGFS